MIKLAILEDIPNVSSNLKQLINSQKDMECPYTYTTVEDAKTFLPQHPVDILIIDLSLPHTQGIESLTCLLERKYVKDFCILTVHADDGSIFKTLQAGARGYMLKCASPEKILNGIRELYQGGAPMSPLVSRRVLERIGMVSVSDDATERLPLSTREEEILHLLAKGHLYKEIADRLQLSVGTIKQHLHRTYKKLQVSNRTEAINKLGQK